MRWSGQAPGSETDEARERSMVKGRETGKRTAMKVALVAGVRRVG